MKIPDHRDEYLESLISPAREDAYLTIYPAGEERGVRYEEDVAFFDYLPVRRSRITKDGSDFDIDQDPAIQNDEKSFSFNDIDGCRITMTGVSVSPYRQSAEETGLL